MIYGKNGKVWTHDKVHPKITVFAIKLLLSSHFDCILSNIVWMLLLNMSKINLLIVLWYVCGYIVIIDTFIVYFLFLFLFVYLLYIRIQIKRTSRFEIKFLFENGTKKKWLQYAFLLIRAFFQLKSYFKTKIINSCDLKQFSFNRKK